MFLIGSYLIERKTLKKTFKTRNIALMALLIALSVVLTNALGYSFFIFGGTIRLALGNFLIFVIGMIFGPFTGMISGLLSDTVGTLINSGGAYHFGFALAKALFGFFGGMVFIFKTNKLWTLKTIGMFIFVFILYSFVISPISVAGLYNNKSIGALIGIGKLIRLPIELLIYIPLTFISFDILYLLLSKSSNKNNYVWCLKNGKINFKPKKTLKEKYKIKSGCDEPVLFIEIVEEESTTNKTNEV
ncbi:folate family ECF transporter S component [Mesoplasma lactucae]|nr:folate family ECF transporter S component [Mesoplasma lactucae]